LQSSDSRKKISFRWNSRSFPASSLVVSSKSAEQQVTESANNGKLVPYEDDITDDSENEREGAETTRIVHVTAEEKTDVDGAGSCENTRSLTTVSLANGKSDVSLSTSDTEQLVKPAEPNVTFVPDCNERLSSSGVYKSHTSISCEMSSNSVSLPELESRRAESDAGTAGHCLGVLANGDMDSSSKAIVDDSSVNQLHSGAPSSANNAVSHAVASRKRHARHKSRRHRAKHRRRHGSSSAWYSSDEEVEYVWVERTAETIAQQLIGKCHLLIIDSCCCYTEDCT